MDVVAEHLGIVRAPQTDAGALGVGDLEALEGDVVAGDRDQIGAGRGLAPSMTTCAPSAGLKVIWPEAVPFLEMLTVPL